MPPKQAKPDSRASTILFKKHKTTVLLSLQPHEPLTAVRGKLLDALRSRNLAEINGESIPTDSTLIEFGVPVDRSDLEKGWKRLETDEDNTSKTTTEKRASSGTVLAAGLDNGHVVAFRFLKSGEIPKGEEADAAIDMRDPGWDVVIPSFDDQEE